MLKFNYQSCFLFIAAALLLASCQRDVDGSLPSIKVSSKNPATLSASLKVWHGVRTTGTAPAPTGNTPAIDPTLNPTVKAFAGRYAIIKPEVTSGVVAGYYIGVPGSGQYFKLDFSKPRDIAGRNIRPNRNGILHRTTSGTADSSIVIVLPPNINVPDTFCVTYCPYDSSGNIGQPVTTCIIVTSLGAGTNNGWLQNDFKLTSSWDVSGGVRINVDTVIYNKWMAQGDGYFCDNSTNPPTLSSGALTLGYIPIVSDSIFYRKNNIRFAINGAFDYKLNEDDKFVLGTCTQITFSPEYYADSLTGAYSYNSTTNKLVFIWEFDAQNLPDPEYWEYDVIKINDNHFILRDPIDNYFIRFQR